ncbi:FG-GAP repeat protein [Portibacter lacus]|uniref:Uncharacterized protein n=1 Tax=Portibacter lacus TaxID=1099794 RepID=A0AA37WH32_9BACT|nr:FG-GAP repeat protein [Portibacter lacus]GLR18809.1 hypothetical protein GCM10007940_34250 [Portibacter lacus]
MKTLYLILFMIPPFVGILAQNTITATYNTGDIPTSFDSYDDSCNGPSATLSVTLPPGDNYNVVAVDVEYDMTAIGTGQKSHQRSLIKFQNTNKDELQESAGKGSESGTYKYSRTINIANGNYPGGSELIFEIMARRTVEGIQGCNTLVNRVDATTWKITVHYSDEISNPKVGINNISPSQAMDVAGKIKLGDDNTLPEEGTIRWNASIKDFEGFNGSEWLSFTKNEGGNWGNKDITENGNFAAYDGQEFDQIGNAVSISGNYAIAGARNASVGNNNGQGKVYLFTKNGDHWLDGLFKTSSDGSAGDYFGSAVSISNDYALIGAPGKDVGGNAEQGKAYIFKKNNGSWAEESSLVSSDGTISDNFGSSLSISGDYAIIGAPYKTVGSNEFQGKAYIFKRDGMIWSEHAILTAPDGMEYDQFGSEVSISGDYVIIGVEGKDVGSNTNQGKAYIFKRSGSAWNLQSELLASNETAYSFFGSAVSISGDYASVTYFDYSVGEFGQGKVCVYKRSGTSWNEQVCIIDANGADIDQFGSSLSMSGDHLVIGASQKNVLNNSNQGKGFIYKRSGSLWSEQAGVVSSDGKAGDFFGFSVAIDGNNVIIGSTNKDVNGNIDQGKVYFYSKDE